MPVLARSRTSPACCGPDRIRRNGAFRRFPRRRAGCKLPTSADAHRAAADAAARTIRGTRRPGPMDIYLPIAEVSLDVFVLLGLGAAVGFAVRRVRRRRRISADAAADLYRRAAGVAVASSANQLVGASVSGVHRALAARQCRFQDGHRSCCSAAWPARPSACWLFTLLKQLGQVELTISLLYVLAARHARRADDGRERPRAVAPAPARRRAPQAASAQLDARPAAEDALSPLEAVYQRAAAGRARLRGRRAQRRSSASAAALSWCRR